MHCIEHRDKIAIGLVDPKQVEFSSYKGMNGVVGVANNTLETVELLRIARQVMLKRNKEMAKLGIKSLTEYKPSKKTDKIFVTGRDYKEDDTLEVRQNGEIRKTSAKSLWEMVQDGREVEVCLNGKDWIPVNKNCVDYYYEDSFPILLVVVDELAELTQKGGLKTAQGKEEDAMKDEIIGIIQSITQLGRSAGVLMILCTQKPNASIVPTVIRSNCGFRGFCGRATEAGASLVALDSTLATTVDNTHPGAGIIQSAGNPAFVRYYFSKFEDLDKYYADRGLDKLGYNADAEEELKALENLGGDEEISSTNEKLAFEFESEKTEIDKREDQKFEEI